MEVVDETGAEELCFGDYVVVRHIATGGMAEIYLARDGRLPAAEFQQLFVIKQLLPSLASTPSFLNMFIDEARIAQYLDHPNIVRVFDTGRVQDSFFFCMEFLHGNALPAIHRQLRKQRTRLTIDHAVGVVIQLCSALTYAHDRCCDNGLPLEIVHRDISHSNVHIKYDGTVKLLDFGIARARNRMEETCAGVLKGKLRSMSPEQALSGEIDRRSDLFSLCIFLWELTTGRRLFDQGADFEVLQAVGEAKVTRPSAVRQNYPRKLEDILMKGLERDPADRYQTASELGQALCSFAADAGLDTSREALSDLMVDLFSSQVQAACDAPSEYARCVEELAEIADRIDDEEPSYLEIEVCSEGEFEVTESSMDAMCTVQEVLMTDPGHRQRTALIPYVLVMCLSLALIVVLTLWNPGGSL